MTELLDRLVWQIDLYPTYMIELFDPPVSQVDVYAGAVFIQQAVGWNTYLSIMVLLAVTAAYTIVGKTSRCKKKNRKLFMMCFTVISFNILMWYRVFTKQGA